jgi:segregation and condensation protein B
VQAGLHAPNASDPVAGPDLDLDARIEAILFVAGRPLSVPELAVALGSDRRGIEAALAQLSERHRFGGVRLQRDGRSVQLVTAPQAASDVERFLGLEANAHLSQAALETLAIVAYRQPVTKPEIEELRGVNVDAVIRTLIGRDLVAETGRRQTVGLPIEYGTTFRFLEYFGLDSLTALPPVDGALQARAQAPLLQLLEPANARRTGSAAENAVGAVHVNGAGDD